MFDFWKGAFGFWNGCLYPLYPKELSKLYGQSAGTKFEGEAVVNLVVKDPVSSALEVYLDRMVLTGSVTADTKEAALLQAAAADTKPVPETVAVPSGLLQQKVQLAPGAFYFSIKKTGSQNGTITMTLLFG